MTASYDYPQAARVLAGGEGPQSNAIFHALMQAHQRGKMDTLVDLAATIGRQASGAMVYLHVLLMRTPTVDEHAHSLGTAPETMEGTMPISLKEKAIEQLNTGWHTAAMLGHCIGCARKTAEGIIRAIKKERSDVRKLSVSGKGYYCLAQPATPQEDTP